MPEFNKIEKLVKQRNELRTRLNSFPFDGAPEIKNRGDNKYLYVRKRVGTKQTSTYVGPYSNDLHNLLFNNSKTVRSIKKELRIIEKQLLELGYNDDELDSEVNKNILFARANLKENIYNQAFLEGISASFSQIEQILDDGIIKNLKMSDIMKIVNLKRAWEFILDKDVITSRSDFYILSYIAQYVNDGLIVDGGRIRAVPVTIGGSSYIPPIPFEADVKDKIIDIIEEKCDAIDVAIKLCLYVMKTQIFVDGNKRAAIIFANHFLIAHAGGLLIIPKNEVSKFKKLLVKFYEGEDHSIISTFLKERCYRPLDF